MRAEVVSQSVSRSRLGRETLVPYLPTWQAFVVFEYADAASDELWSAALLMARQVAAAAAMGVVPLVGHGE